MALDFFSARTGRRGMGRMGEKRKRGSPFFRTPSFSLSSHSPSSPRLFIKQVRVDLFKHIVLERESNMWYFWCRSNSSSFPPCECHDSVMGGVLVSFSVCYVRCTLAHLSHRCGLNDKVKLVARNNEMILLKLKGVSDRLHSGEYLLSDIRELQCFLSNESDRERH